MKYLLLIGDGMGDYPIAELGNRTPLQAACTPAMDSLCQKGELFLTNTIPDNFPPGSDVANLSLLGYDPAQYYTGRAPLEAASMGITLAPDETAFRCNLVTLTGNGSQSRKMVDFSAGHISSEEAKALIQSLEKECGSSIFHFTAGISYRHLLTVKGNLPDFTTVPPHDYIEKDVTLFWQDYFTSPEWAEMLVAAEKILAEHPVNIKRQEKGHLPANAIWPWGEGKMPSMPSLFDRFGIRGSMISAVDLLKGLGINAGLNVINVPGATAYLDTNYQGKAQAALDALQTQDFVFVHVEAPDETGHQGLVNEKVQAIEDFDSKIVSPIITSLQRQKIDFRVIATMDHFTPIALRTHTRDPIPTLLYDSRQQSRGSALTFSEENGLIAAQNATSPPLKGHKLINKLLQSS